MLKPDKPTRPKPITINYSKSISMGAIKLQYLINDKGEKVGVFLPISQYNELIEKLEELEDIKAYDEAKASPDEFIPVDQAFKEIEDNPDAV